jgi:hypothetical protein
MIIVVGGCFSSYFLFGIWSMIGYADYPLEHFYIFYFWLLIGVIVVFVGVLLLIVRAIKLRAEGFGMGDREYNYRKFGVVFVLIGFSVFAYFFGWDVYNWNRYGYWNWVFFDIVVFSIILGFFGVVLLIWGSGVWFIRVGLVLICYMGISHFAQVQIVYVF